MTAFLEFVNVASLARTVLDAALDCGCYSSIPKNPTYPLVTVRRIGGVPTEKHALDLVRLQVDVWGTSDTEAFDIATAARVVLHGLPGAHTDPVSVFVTHVRDDLGLACIPDAGTNRDRYVFGVAITATPS